MHCQIDVCSQCCGNGKRNDFALEILFLLQIYSPPVRQGGAKKAYLEVGYNFHKRQYSCDF